MDVALSPEAGNVEQDSRFCMFVSGRIALFFMFCVVKEIGQFECVKCLQTAIVACIESFHHVVLSHLGVQFVMAIYVICTN